MKQVTKLEEKIAVVSIGKKGSRNQAEHERETTEAFIEGQRFRAGAADEVLLPRLRIAVDVDVVPATGVLEAIQVIHRDSFGAGFFHSMQIV